MLDELPHRHSYPTKKKFWMQRLRTKKGVLPSGGKTSGVTKISVHGEERRNARKDDTPSVPLAPETERSRGQGRQVSPLDFGSDSFRLVPTVTSRSDVPKEPLRGLRQWEREAQDALRHRSVPTREPAFPALRDPERQDRTGRRGNKLMDLVLDFANDSS
jgi:hypothetical protein